MLVLAQSARLPTQECVKSHALSQRMSLTMQDSLTVVGCDFKQEGVLRRLGAAVPAPEGLGTLASGADLFQPAFQQDPVCWNTATKCNLQSTLWLLTVIPLSSEQLARQQEQAAVCAVHIGNDSGRNDRQSVCFAVQNLQMPSFPAFGGVLHWAHVADSCLGYSMTLCQLQTGQHCWANDTSIVV